MSLTCTEFLLSISTITIKIVFDINHISSLKIIVKMIFESPFESSMV